MDKSTLNNKASHCRRMIYGIVKKELNVNPYSLKQMVNIKYFCDTRNLKVPSRKYVKTFLAELWDNPNFEEVGRQEPTRNYTSGQFNQCRKILVAKYGSKCMKCGSEENIAVDHIKPYSLFPELSLDMNNLQLLCKSCNSKKSNRRQTDYRPFL